MSDILYEIDSYLLQYNVHSSILVKPFDSYVQPYLTKLKHEQSKQWFLTVLKNYLLKQPDTLHPVSKLPKNPTPQQTKAFEFNDLNDLQLSPTLKDQLDHIVDFLNSKEAESKQDSLLRVSFPQMIAHSDNWTQQLNKKASSAEDSEGTKTLLTFPDGFKLIELFSQQALDREGKLMQHCVGSYYQQVKEESVKVVSLRDLSNNPHATLELHGKEILQIKGKQNKAPIQKYWSYLHQYIKQFNLKVISDHLNIGLVKVDSRTMTLEEFVNSNNLVVRGDLYLNGCTSLTSLPTGLSVEGYLNLYGCTSLTSLPTGLSVKGYLDLNGCTSLTSLPTGLSVEGNLDLRGCTSLTGLPTGLSVEGYLYLGGCTALTSLPSGLSVKGYLDLAGCASLTSLPTGLSVEGYLDLGGCTSLTSLPTGLSVGGGLYLRGCTSLTSLPTGLSVKGYLDLGGCTSLTSLPTGLSVGGDLYLSKGSKVKIPDHLKSKVKFF